MDRNWHDDDHSDLSALDFSSGGDYQSDADDSVSDAFDFSVKQPTTDESGFDALDDYAPQDTVDVADDLHAIDPAADIPAGEVDEVAPYLSSVTNPPESVTVSALMGGSVFQVELSPKVTQMTESELADEILVIADLARQKAMASQTKYLSESDFLIEGMSGVGLDSSTVVKEFFETGMNFPSAEAAEAAQAEVFATRYSRNDE